MAGLTVNDPVTLQTLVNSDRIIPGDTIYIRGGTYTLADMFLRWLGTAEAPITISPYESESVIFQPISGTRIMLISGQYITLSGPFVFDGANVQECVKITNEGVNVPVGIILDGAELKDAAAQGILISASGTSAILRNLNIHGIGATKGDHAIYVSDGTVTIHNCECYGNAGYGIHIYGGNSTTEIYKNYCHDNTESGIGLFSNNSLCYNNVSRGNEAGVRVRYGARNIEVYFNTLIDNVADNLDVRDTSRVAFNAKIYNNLCIGSPLGIYIATANDALAEGAIEIKNNLTYGASLYNLLVSELDTNTVTQSNNLTDDPAPYTDDTADTIYPTTGSPLLGAGLAVVGITDDYADNPRSSPPTIGAYE